MHSRHMLNVYLRSMRPYTWSPRSIQMLGRLQRSWTKNAHAERFEGKVHVNQGVRSCINGSHSPLHGLPILIKNNIATADRMNNTAGSFSLLGAKVSRDATVAAKLRAAGAILLGKTNLSQWANFRSGNSSNGWSAYGGQTYGAYYPGQDPSGSSSGSGVSASLGLAFGTLGTETDGSIVSPSQLNNVVGIKPTVRSPNTTSGNQD